MTIKNFLKIKINQFLNKFGINLNRYNLNESFEFRFNYFLEKKEIDCVFDIGANTGQYSKFLRGIGYKKKIISFEPLSDAFNQLKKNSISDKSWKIYNYGVGEKNEEININISENSYSSSILNMNKEHLYSAPDSRYIGKEKIKIVSVSDFIKEKNLNYKKIFLKMDVQGYEHKILDGINDFKNIEGIQVEMSINSLYENQIIFEDLYKKIKKIGYELWDFQRGFSDENSGKILQLDGIFFKS